MDGRKETERQHIHFVGTIGVLQAAARYDLAKPGSLRVCPSDDKTTRIRSDFRDMREMFFVGTAVVRYPRGRSERSGGSGQQLNPKTPKGFATAGTAGKTVRDGRARSQIHRGSHSNRFTNSSASVRR
jgi:hypothetical protein